MPSVLPLLQGAQFATVVSPIFVFVLIRYVSGVPKLAASAEQRWGATAAYQAYKASTNLLLPIPVPWRRCRRSDGSGQAAGGAGGADNGLDGAGLIDRDLSAVGVTV